MENEIWKVYKESYSRRYGKIVYEVSDQGNVKANGVLVNFSEKTDYYKVGSFRVHRAVAELYVPNTENKPYVDHINTNIHDNRAINLRWVTIKENNNNPLTKQHMSDAAKVAQNRLEVKAKRSASLKEANKNPELNARRSASVKEAFKNPEVKTKHHAAVKEAQNRPEVKTKHRAAVKEANNRPEVKLKKKIAMKDRVWITNGINNKLIKPEIVDYYLERGYHLGRK